MDGARVDAVHACNEKGWTGGINEVSSEWSMGSFDPHRKTEGGRERVFFEGGRGRVAGDRVG